MNSALLTCVHSGTEQELEQPLTTNRPSHITGHMTGRVKALQARGQVTSRCKAYVLEHGPVSRSRLISEGGAMTGGGGSLDVEVRSDLD